MVRAVFGVPAGFGEDFISPAAFRQALCVQVACVGFVFVVLGVASARMLRTVRYWDAVGVANPLTVGVGFAAYKSIYHALNSPDYLAEYDSLPIFAIFCLAAPLVFAGCFYVGTYLRRRRL
jgi:hypothetical protein